MTSSTYDPSPSARSLPPALRSLWALVLGISALEVVYCVAAYLRGAVLDFYWPLTTRSTRFMDFTIYHDKFLFFFHTAEFWRRGWPFTYPAPVSLVYEIFYRLFGERAAEAFSVFTIAAFVIPGVLFGRALAKRGITPFAAYGFALTLSLLSWPAILVWDRGNMEVVVWIALAAAFWAYSTGRGYLGATLFGVAAAAKLFPFVFLALFFSTREYRKIAAGVASFFAVSIASLAFLGPTIPAAYVGVSYGLRFFRVAYMAKWLPFESGVDHSLFALIKAVLLLAFHANRGDFNHALTLYLAGTALLGTTLYFVRIRTLPLLNQVLILSICSMYLTPFSGDGTLLHLYYPVAMLAFLAIAAHRRGVHIAGLRGLLLTIGFLVSTESFFQLRIHGHEGVHHFEGQVKCLVITGLLIATFVYRFGSADRQGMRAELLAHPDDHAIGLARA